jgi:ATP-binding cassette subfamily C protein
VAEPAAEPLDAAPAIEFRGVSWHAPAAAGSPRGAAETAEGTCERPPLDRVTAVIPAGRVTALVGESGAGKSTLCDLAVGLLTPTEGEVRLDGRPLDPALARRLRASVAYVGQEPFLFEDSLRHNLCWGCGPVQEAEIWQALETVEAAGLARRLEGGLDGRIRRDGARFSGGERQRLRLARALLRRPRLMVLDEATNALDLEAESRVLQALFAARGGASVLMVSHRPANLALAEHVIVLEEGRLAETGPTAGLAADPASRIAAMLGRGGQ